MDAQVGIFEDLYSNKSPTNNEELKEIALLSDNTRIRRDSLSKLISKHFEGSTLKRNRIVTADEKYDIIVRNNLDIVVVKHNENYLKVGDMEIVYYVPEENAVEKTIELYFDLGTGNPETKMSYEEYRANYFEGKTDTELEELVPQALNKDMTFDELLEEEHATRQDVEAEAQENNMTYREFLEAKVESIVQNNYNEYLAGIEGLDLEGLEGKYTELAAKNMPDATITNFDEALAAAPLFGKNNKADLYAFAEQAEMSPEELLKFVILLNAQYGSYILLTCPDGSVKNVTESTMYAEYTVSEAGDYKFTATGPRGEKAEAIITVTGIGEIFSTIYDETTEYVDSKGKKATIPKGFAVGISNGINSIDEGLVITDEVDRNGFSTGNEFVWVPVDNPNDFYGTNANGKYMGKLYDIIGRRRCLRMARK